ncbi:MAG: GGDEF domain-containing protein [Lachnospiraceae bacterium]|nr:GGDEF domain-containing protein [Lachnospiraceae bacterium]
MNSNKKRGISHRLLHLWLVIVIVIFSGTVVHATFRLTETFLDVSVAFDQNSDLQKAAYELMNASDYLTEQVQRFTVAGDRRFMDNYFKEALESRRREEAIEKMQIVDGTDAARGELQQALNDSIELMDLEYYAMRLVLEAKEYDLSDCPEILSDVKLSEEDADLSPQEKMRRATELVLSEEYYGRKDQIRTNMQESLEEVEKLANANEEVQFEALSADLQTVRMSILIEAGLVFFLLFLTTLLAINPVLNAVGKIREDLPIPEIGSREFKYLASAYNKMYQKNKTNLANLSFMASHDELTGAFNRAGYDLMLESVDLEDTYMMLFDVDNFKSINDTYGHEAGDKVLIKLVNILKKVFRDEDCICRIGGDEFVVFVMHSAAMGRKLIESKMEQINQELADTEDGLPSISISVGIVSGQDASGPENLFEKTDAAMYESKKHGKHTYTFYTSGLEND